MKKLINRLIPAVALVPVLVLILNGCVSLPTVSDDKGSAGGTQSDQIKPAAATSEATSIDMPRDYVPQYAVDEAERFKKDFLSEYSQAASDLTYRFFYNEKGEACLEYTVTAKGNYSWSEPTWIGFIWGNGEGSIGNNETVYSQTKEKADEAVYRMERRREDSLFREIEEIVLQVAYEYDYDFYGAYGIRAKYRKADVKKAVCDGYSDAIVRNLENHPQVSEVEKWVGHDHAWNKILLKDGRTLYCDATWYDSNSIDEEGYVVNIPERNPVNLTFDIDEFNSLGGAINRRTGKLLQVHFAWDNISLDG